MICLRNQACLLNLCIHRSYFSRSMSNKYNLTEVGKFIDVKSEQYETGQLIFHKIFGYRGIVLFPWQILVSNKDEMKSLKHDEFYNKDENDDLNCVFRDINKKVLDSLKSIKRKGKLHTYYQVLIDIGDFQHVRVPTEGITYLAGNYDGDQSFYNIPGLDYVAHEDIFPYMTTDKKPIRHDLFDQFLTYVSDKDPPFSGKERLKEWKDRNNWLDLTYVQKQTTENVRVTVIPYYMGSRLTQGQSNNWWRCVIRVENLGEKSVQLRERSWRIFPSTGSVETIRAPGVCGQKPVLSMSHPTYQFQQHISLHAPAGHIIGSFRFEREDGHIFDCKIPSFSLESELTE